MSTQNTTPPTAGRSIDPELARVFHQQLRRPTLVLLVSLGVGGAIMISSLVVDTDTFGRVLVGLVGAFLAALGVYMSVSERRRLRRVLTTVSLEPHRIVWLSCVPFQRRGRARPSASRRLLNIHDDAGDFVRTWLRAPAAESALAVLTARCPRAAVSRDPGWTAGWWTIWKADPKTFPERVRETAASDAAV